jgi:Amt family ammonium transporter
MAPVFLAGAVVGRMKFGSYIIFIILWTLIVYNCLAHWIWGNYIDPNTFQPTQLGWLGIRGTIDYAGGAVIHITAGFAALATTLVLGKRRDYEYWPRIAPRPHNRSIRPYNVAPTPHNVPLVAIGFTLIWFGWFGYTGGANGTANGVAANALMTTQVAASTGLLWWLILEYIVDRQITLVGATFGALSGLVAITPAAGYVWPWTALMFGIFAASFGFIFSRLKYVLRYDDPFDVFAIHGVCGCVGMFMTGLFASPNVNNAIAGGAWYGPRVVLGYQMAGLVVAAAFSFVCTFLIVFILHKTIGIRVEDKSEDLGLDHRYHGAPAYYFDEPVVTDLPYQTKVVSVNYNQAVVTTEGPLKRDEHVISS